MASSPKEEISLKELTTQVVEDQLSQIIAFKIVLNTFLETNKLTGKCSPDEVFKSVTELLSLASVVRNHFDTTYEQFGVHLVSYPALQNLEKAYSKCLTFRRLLRLKKDMVTDVEAGSPIDASSVSDFVLEKSTPNKHSLKCSSCTKACNPSCPKNRDSQFTCITVDVNKRCRAKKQ